MKEFNRYLDLSAPYLGKINCEELIGRLTSEETRNALHVPQFNHLLSYGITLKTHLDPASSDEGSDDYVSYPSVHKVSQRILDINSLKLSDFFFESEHLPCIFAGPLKIDLKSDKISQRLGEIGVDFKEIQIIDFNSQFPKAGLLWFNELKQANNAFEILSNAELPGVCGDGKMVKWADYKVLYTGFNFFAVILRGFSMRMSKADLNKFLPVTAKNCEIRILNRIACGVFIMNSVLDVCIVCNRCNGAKDPWGNVVKAHVHPDTQKKYSKVIIETLMSDLPKAKVEEGKSNVDVMKLLNLGMAKTQGLNPLQNLIRRKK